LRPSFLILRYIVTLGRRRGRGRIGGRRRRLGLVILLPKRLVLLLAREPEPLTLRRLGDEESLILVIL
jgi:hypothetical protein